jgi:transcriptional regulator with XRE-family HTH domain
VDVSLVIKQRLEEFGLEQRDLARAAQVTESYISQLLTRRRSPPAPRRTDIYEKMDKFLRLPRGELARVADQQRKEGLKRELGDQPAPLFQEVRALILRKCHPGRERQIRAVFEKEPFGELERLVTRTVLDVVKVVAAEELENDQWLRMVAKLSRRSYEETRVIVLEFLDTDIFHLSEQACVSFLGPLVESWDINLTTFALDIVLNPKVVAENKKRFEFVERGAEQPVAANPGFEEFLNDPALSGSATEQELAFLEQLRFTGRRPTALYYYRELQNLRDPLNFHSGSEMFASSG